MTAGRAERRDLADAAVLVVDLQEEQRSGTEFPVEGIEAVLANTAHVLAAARRAGRPVLYARYVRDFATAAPRRFEPVAADGRPSFSVVGSPGVEICAEVAPADGETVFDKQAASAFANPALGEHLARAGIATLLVCGVWTEACVAATVRDACDRGLGVFLVKDACGSGTTFMHRTATLHLANRLYGGGIVTAAACAEMLAGHARPVWTCRWPVPFRFTADDIDGIYESL